MPKQTKTHETTRSILENCGLFRSLAPQWLGLLSENGSLRHLKRNQMIFRQGDVCPGLYCVGSGSVKVFKISPAGKEHILHLAGPGQTFAEVAAIGEFSLPAYAQTLESTTCVLIPTIRLRHLLATHHEFCLQLLSGMSLWVRQLIALLEDIVLRDAAGRVARHLIDADPSAGKCPFALPIRKKDLASHLNLTSETLSRTLRRLTDSGLIQTPTPQTVRIIDREQLEEVSAGILPAEFE